MKLAFAVAFVLVGSLVTAPNVNAQTSARYAPSCEPHETARAVVWFAEGTVWRVGFWRDAWLGVFNPYPTAQNVLIILHPEGRTSTYQTITVGGLRRRSVPLYQWLPQNQNTVFAVEVIFNASAGAANLTTWDFLYSTPSPVQGTTMQLCTVGLGLTSEPVRPQPE